MNQFKIGDYILADEPIIINNGRRTIELTVKNSGLRTIQIGSHFHFFEVNRALIFDREAAYGLHLDIPSGTAIRFAPLEEKTVQLTEYAGNQALYGFNSLTNGCVTDEQVKKAALKKARADGFIKD